MALVTDSTALATKEVPDKGDKADNVATSHSLHKRKCFTSAIIRANSQCAYIRIAKGS